MTILILLFALFLAGSAEAQSLPIGNYTITVVDTEVVLDTATADPPIIFLVRRADKLCLAIDRRTCFDLPENDIFEMIPAARFKETPNLIILFKEQ